jgi:hypothetical protein
MVSRLLIHLYRRLPRQAICTLTPSCSGYALTHGILAAAHRASMVGEKCVGKPYPGTD